MGKLKVTAATRWEIIGLSRAGTFSNRKIAEILKVSEKCVRTTLKNYRSLGSLLELTRPGRPKKLSKRQEHHIFRKARTHFKWS